jgi:hypothetical protein
MRWYASRRNLAWSVKKNPSFSFARKVERGKKINELGF